MGSRVTEITALLTKLASHLQTPQSSTTHQESLLPSISSLNHSLNLNEDSSPGVRVLDAALSLMCFKAPQVFQSVTECMVQTIVSVLCSSVCCKVLHFEKDEVLKVGSSLCCCDCSELFEALSDVLKKLEECGMTSHSLLYAALRVAVSSSCYQSSFPCRTNIDEKSAHQKCTAISKFHGHIPEEISGNNFEVPSRLFFWYLDPLTLRHDVSEILRDYLHRPFLSLKKELHERATWRSVMICLALSPIMFIETRTLLHNWFLQTGLVSIQDLEIEFVSSVLDVLAQPMRWGISMQVGSNLPFSHAYFPNQQRLLKTLAGPISCEAFLCLCHLIRGLGCFTEKISDPTARETFSKARILDDKSTWGILMDFPQWFLFAAVLLFCGKNCPSIFLSESTLYPIKTEQKHAQYCDAAARYLAHILSPISETNCEMLVDHLIKLSKSWKSLEFHSDAKNVSSVCTKKLKKLRVNGLLKDNKAGKVCDFNETRIWLDEFHECYLRYLIETDVSFKPSGSDSRKHNSLFKKIPLGIIICYSNLDEEVCELLLHYASASESDGCSSEMEDSKAGICLVFNLFDTIQEMTTAIFRTEEIGLNFFCQLKAKTVMFLVKCTRRLLQLNTDKYESEILTLTDLYKRLIQWRHLGQEDFEGCNALDEITRALNCKISSYNKVL